MIINTYNPTTMALEESDVTGIDFGDVLKTQHNSSPVVLKPVLEDGETLSQLAFYLESTNGLDRSTFGKYKSTEAVMGIPSGSDYLSDHFIVQEGISDFFDFEGTSDAGLTIDPSSPEYLWLDVQAGSAETGGDAQVNFRFVFEYI
jgi:hypothetical protein